MADDVVEIYSDGACRGNPGPGGWGALLRADKKPVKNIDLWKRLDELAAQHQVEWHWVRGHAGHPENERADALANKGIPKLDGNSNNDPPGSP
jgi:ribonuclease HI